MKIYGDGDDDDCGVGGGSSGGGHKMKIMMMTYDNINIILLYCRLHLFCGTLNKNLHFLLILGNQNDNIAKQTIPQIGQGK